MPFPERLSDTMAWVYSRGALLYVSGDRTLSEKEWDAHIEDCGKPEGSPLRVLIWVGHATPTAEMRDKIRRLIQRRQVVLAYITASAWTHGVLRVMALWPGMQTRGVRSQSVSKPSTSLASRAPSKGRLWRNSAT